MTDDKTTTALTPAMKRVLIAVAVVVVVGAVAAIWLFSSASGGDSAAPANATPTATSSPSIGPGDTSTSDPSASDGPVPDATPTFGSEARQPSATPGYRLPPIAPSKPLVSAPLPPSASAQGRLASGFPTKIMGPSSKSTVESTSIASQGTTMQATLVARSTASHKSIKAHYQKLWAGLGLRAGATSDTTMSYVGDHESLTLAFGSTGTGNRYAIYGVFRTK